MCGHILTTAFLFFAIAASTSSVANGAVQRSYDAILETNDAGVITNDVIEEADEEDGALYIQIVKKQKKTPPKEAPDRGHPKASKDAANLHKPCHTHGAILPHYGDCAKFVVCVFGIKVPMDCARGTKFDVKRNACVYADRANCARLTTTVATTEINTTEKATTEVPAATIIESVSTSSISEESDGSGDDDFGVTTTTTTAPPKSTTATPETTTTPPKTTTAPPKTTPATSKTTIVPPKTTATASSTTRAYLEEICLHNNGVLVSNPSDCRGFFHCDNGVPRPRRCAPGTAYNKGKG